MLVKIDVRLSNLFSRCIAGSFDDSSDVTPSARLDVTANFSDGDGNA
jgi:hypothetical protein